ncbi:MAG: cytochrome c, partial [Actinomycetota bacterium]
MNRGDRRMGMQKIAALVALALAATLIVGCGGGDDTVQVTTSSGTQSRGEQLAVESCTSCHGADFEGVDKLGPGLRGNAYIRDHTDEELVAFIKEGRPREADDNTTGIAMPAYGGNPRLTDDDLAEIA